ncbi:MAG: hypothetical protein JWQ04_2091 [Pedosphaera sp.]|nr:hypothetical protein [Pedosphaera sp.]
MKHFLIFLGILGLTGGAPVFGAGRGDEVFVVYNSRVPESRGVAEHYASVRQVPATQVLGLDLPEGEAMNRTDFRERLQKPLTKALEARGLFHFDAVIVPATADTPRRVERKLVQSKIRYLCLCYGVPLLISKDLNLHEAEADRLPEELRRNQAAVDNELACLPVLDRNMLLAGPRINPFYGCTNAQQLNPTNGILLVTRLDGPTAEIARGLVDKALAAETNGLWGRAYFDLRGLTNGPLKMGDDWIHGASEVCRQLGFETVVDTNGGTFPASFPLSQTAFYAGWYDENVSGPFTRPTVEFMPGAFAYHLHSFSAATLRSTKRQWAGPLLDRGVTATMGCVDEPYLGGTPNIGIFFARFIYSGFSFGEAAYAAQNYVSWQTTVVGDPLYRPYARGPVELEEDLKRRHNGLVDWAYLRVVNLNLINGVPLEKVTSMLEDLEPARESAVLQEKLGQLYFELGKPSSSVHALQQALKFSPSHLQRQRIMLALAERLIPLGRDQDAYEVYQEFLKQFPDYPDQLAVYRPLLDLAQKLDHKTDATKYLREITLLTEPHVPAEKGPPLRHGTS